MSPQSQQSATNWMLSSGHHQLPLSSTPLCMNIMLSIPSQNTPGVYELLSSFDLEGMQSLLPPVAVGVQETGLMPHEKPASLFCRQLYPWSQRWQAAVIPKCAGDSVSVR